MMDFMAFDVDGTLFSSEHIIHGVYIEALASYNRKYGACLHVPSKDEIMVEIGKPIQEIFDNLFGAGGVDFEPLAREIGLVLIRQVKARRGLLYEGVYDTLSLLHASGMRMGVASNGRREYIEAILSTYSLNSFMVPGLYVEGAVKNKTGILRGYIDEFRLNPARTVMVGDRYTDFEAARETGCVFIGCSYGHADKKEMEGADYFIERFSDLLHLPLFK